MKTFCCEVTIEFDATDQEMVLLGGMLGRLGCENWADFDPAKGTFTGIFTQDAETYEQFSNLVRGQVTETCSPAKVTGIVDKTEEYDKLSIEVNAWFDHLRSQPSKLKKSDTDWANL